MQKQNNPSNIKMQINNFTLNLQTLLSGEDELLSTTKRKKSKTHRTKSDFQEISPLKVKKKTKQKHQQYKKTKLTSFNQVHKVSSKTNQTIKQSKKQSDSQKIKRQKQSNPIIKKNKNSSSKVKKSKNNNFQRHFTEYDHVMESARLTTSPSLNANNYKFNSQQISKSASRSRSKSYTKNFGDQKFKQTKQKSLFEKSNQKLSTQRSVQRIKTKKKEQNINFFEKTQTSVKKTKNRKSSKSRQRKSIDDCSKSINKSKSRQRIYTQREQKRTPLNNKHFNSNSNQINYLDAKQSNHKKNIMQSQTLQNEASLGKSQSVGILRPKFTSNKFYQNQKKNRKCSKEKNCNIEGTISQKFIQKSDKKQKGKSPKKNIKQTHNSKPQLNKYRQKHNLYQSQNSDAYKKQGSSQKKNNKMNTQSQRFFEQKSHFFNELKFCENKQQKTSAFKKKKAKDIIQKLFQVNHNESNDINQHLSQRKRQVKYSKPSNKNQSNQSQKNNKEKVENKKIRPNIKKLTIQTQFNEVEKKQSYFDDLVKYIKKHENIICINQESRNSIIRSQKSIKQEIMSNRKQHIENVSNQFTSKIEKEGNDEDQIKLVNFRKVIENQSFQLQQKQSNESEKRQSSESFTYLLNNKNSNQGQSQIQMQGQGKSNQSNQLQQESYSQKDIKKISVLDLEDSQEEQEQQEQSQQSKKFIKSNFKQSNIKRQKAFSCQSPSLQNQLLAKQEEQLIQLVQMNDKIDQLLRSNPTENLKDQKNIQDVFDQKQQQNLNQKVPISSNSRHKSAKPKSLTLLSLAQNKITKMLNNCKQTNQDKHCVSTTFIQREIFKRSPLVSPSTYAVQNKQKIISSLKKPRKSVQQQMFIAKSLSNKKLIEQLKLFQNMQKSLQNSVNLQLFHHEERPKTANLNTQIIEDKQKRENHPNRKNQKISNKINNLKLQIKFIAQSKDINSRQLDQIFEKQDSPLLSSICFSSTKRISQKQNEEIHQTEQFNQEINQENQIGQLPQKSVVEEDSSLSLYHEKNLLQLKKCDYSHLSLEFEKQMQEYLKDSSQKIIEDQIKALNKTNKQNSNTSGRSEEYFYYGKTLNSLTDSKQISYNNHEAHDVQNLFKISNLNSHIKICLDHEQQQRYSQDKKFGTNHSQLIKSQLISHVLNLLLSEFTSFLDINKNILHSFLYYVSSSNVISFQNQINQQNIDHFFNNDLQKDFTHFSNDGSKGQRQIKEDQFKQYLQSKIQASNEFILNLSSDLFAFIKKSPQRSAQLLKNINQSFGLKPLKTLKWMKKAFAQNDASNNSEEEEQEQLSEASQSQQVEAVLSPILLADFDTHQNQLIFQQINEEQYYLNHAIYASLNQICDTLRPYGQNGPPVIPRYKHAPSHSISNIEKKVSVQFKRIIQLRMGRSSFNTDQQPEKIITQSYKRMDQMIVAQQNEKWIDRNLEDMIFQSQYYLALQIVDLVFIQQIMQIYRILQG